MPIEFAPPPVNLQGFNIQPPPQGNPLETLARFGQLRNENLQRQAYEQQLEQQKLKLGSQQGMMRLWRDTGGKLDEMEKRVGDANYGIMGEDWLAVKQHFADEAYKRAQIKLTGTQAEKAKLEAQDLEHDQLSNAYRPASEEKDQIKQEAMIHQTNARLIQQGWDPEKLLQYEGPDSVSDAMHAYTTLNSMKAQADIAEKRALERQHQLEATKLGQETEANTRQQALSFMQTIPKDEKGMRTMAGWQQFRERYKDKGYNIPEIPSPLWEKDFARSVVGAKDQPEYDLKTMQADLGLLGTDAFDKYELRFAQDRGKKPSELTFPEKQEVRQLWAKDSTNPELLASILALRGPQTQLAEAALKAVPPAEEIAASAADLVEGRASPDQIKDWKAGRVATGPQIIQAARKYAAAHNMPFNLANLEIQAETRQDTEKKFATGPEAQMVRSFGNLMGHAALLWDANEALGKNNLPLMQRLAGMIGTATGGDLKTTYDGIAAFVKDEASKAFLPGGGSQGEREEKALSYSSDLGYGQRSKNIRTLMHIADEQRKGLEYQYEEGTFGKGLRQGKLFRPEALTERDRILGRQPRTGGVPPLITTKEQYDKLPSETLYREQDGNTYKKP